MIVTTAQLYKVAYAKFAIGAYNEAMIRTAEGMFPEAIFAVHLDHGDEETCYDCIASGFYSSVMIDAHEPFEKNVAITKHLPLILTLQDTANSVAAPNAFGVALFPAQISATLIERGYSNS